MPNLLTLQPSKPRPASRSDTPLSPKRRSVVVCHPIWELAYGGLERQLAQILPRIADGFEHYLLPRGEASERRQPTPPRVTLVEPPPAQSTSWKTHLTAELRRLRPDVVHVRGIGMLPDAIYAANRAGAQSVVFSFHGLENVNQTLVWYRRPAVRAALDSCSQKWAVSRAARDWIADAAGLPQEQFNVIPNGVDSDFFAPCADKHAAKLALGQPTDRPLILSVGNVKPIKGQHVLVEAARLFKSARSPNTVVVGAEHQSLCPNGAPAPDANDVRFVGRQENVKAWYDAADLFVLPSLFEGLSNALLEAMACGLPVVATDVGGNPDVVRPGVNGLLVPPANAGALGLAVRALLADPAKCHAYGQAARSTVLEQFRLDLAAARTAAAYRRAACRDPRESASGD
jgi:glycosyltransferase involved in cell wall biosynthesis